MRSASRSAALLVALLLARAAAAAPVLVLNPGFETPAQSGMGVFTSVTPPNWLIHDPFGLVGPGTDFGVWWPLGFFDFANVPEGVQVGFVHTQATG